jgi:hypothetical protein
MSSKDEQYQLRFVVQARHVKWHELPPEGIGKHSCSDSWVCHKRAGVAAVISYLLSTLSFSTIDSTGNLKEVVDTNAEYIYEYNSKCFSSNE